MYNKIIVVVLNLIHYNYCFGKVKSFRFLLIIFTNCKIKSLKPGTSRYLSGDFAYTWKHSTFSSCFALDWIRVPYIVFTITSISNNLLSSMQLNDKALSYPQMVKIFLTWCGIFTPHRDSKILHSSAPCDFGLMNTVDIFLNGAQGSSYWN